MSTAKNLATTLLSQKNSALRSLFTKALTRFVPHSRTANVASAVIHKSQGQTKLAASAFTLAGLKSTIPSAYELIAVKLLLGHGYTNEAVSELIDLAKGNQTVAWLEHLADAVTLFFQQDNPLASLLEATHSLQSIDSAFSRFLTPSSMQLR